MLRGLNVWQIQSQFLVAIQYDDIETCATLLAGGADCDQVFRVNCQSRPALSLAVERSAYQLVELFIKSGSSINLPDSQGSTSLHIAVQSGTERICQLLIQNRAYVNAVDNLGVCPLHLAVQRASLSLTQLLISHGADVNRKDQSGKTALHYACSAPRVSHQIVRHLIQNGAKSDEKDDDLKTPLLCALETSFYSFETVQLLIENGARLDVTTNGKAPLHYIMLSYSHDKLKCLDLLLKHGCDVNVQTNKKQTALHLSILMNDKKSVVTLLRANANPNTIDRLGMSPFALAISLGLTDVVDLLLGVGVKVNPAAIPDLDLKVFPAQYQQKVLKKLQTPLSLMEISRKGIYNRFGPHAADKITEFKGNEIPSSTVPFLLLEN